MKSYAIYLVITALYLVLFLLSKGLFGAAAAFLMKHEKQHLAWTSEHAVKMALMLFFLMNFLGLVISVKADRENTVSRGYLVRQEFGGSETSAALDAEVKTKHGTEEEHLNLTLDPRRLTKTETEEWMKEGEAELIKTTLGGQNPSHVSEKLTLPSTVKEDTIEVTWVIDDSDAVDVDGTLSDTLPKEGCDVHLHALMVFSEDSEVTRDVELSIHVEPKELSDAEKRRQELTKEIEEKNDPTSQNVTLPKEINGETIRWSQARSTDGIRLLFLGVLLSIGLLYRETELKRQEETRKRQSLLLDYPQIVSKFVLYLQSGMSARSALSKMAAEYQLIGETKQRKHEGYRCIMQLAADMKNGITERDAYRRLGETCDVAEYKAFSNILLENSMKGGRELLTMLEREADEAVELRRKQARRLGEEAGTKILMPMMVMLFLVMAILMIPAVLNFQF